MLLSSVQAQTPATSALYRYVAEKRTTLKTTSSISLFKESTGPAAALKTTLSTHTNLGLLKNKSQELFADRPQSVSITIPSGNTIHQLELVQEDIAAGKLPVDRQAGAGALPVSDSIDAVHYRGYVTGDLLSIASFSVFANGEVMCMFSGAAGNYNLGKTSNNNYVLYKSSDLLAPLSFDCGTDKLQEIKGSLTKSFEAISVPDAAPDALCKKVRVYWGGEL